jgi:hypothetical protein
MLSSAPAGNLQIFGISPRWALPEGGMAAAIDFSAGETNLGGWFDPEENRISTSGA